MNPLNNKIITADTKYPILVIPAFNPDQNLVLLLQEHRQLSGQECIIVNDGSNASCAPIFTTLAELGYTVLHHAKNLGKGSALKTAMRYYLETYSCLNVGIVTADADGQHSIKDILQVSTQLDQITDSLHLGVRQISKDAPLRSRMGNILTKFIFNFLTKSKITDTQTGLRGIPRALIPHLLAISATRYDFEFEMFFIARRHQFKILEIPIATIYLNNNQGSHFQPVLDSLRIYLVFLRFWRIVWRFR